MELFNDDCFNIIKNINHDVKLVCVDLPYGVLKCKWDIPINIEEMWKQLKSVCNKQCVYLFFCDMRLAGKLIESNPKDYRYDLVWDKVNNSTGIFAKHKPLRRHEYVLVFGKKGVYNPQKSYGHSNYPARKSKIVQSTFRFSQPSVSGPCTDGSRYPTSIMTFKKKKSTKNRHPTQKPTDLLEHLVKQYSNEGDWVLDFTMGSGSCGVACKNTNRKFIGVEKDPKYFEMAKMNLL